MGMKEGRREGGNRRQISLAVWGREDGRLGKLSVLLTACLSSSSIMHHPGL